MPINAPLPTLKIELLAGVLRSVTYNWDIPGNN